MEADALAGVVRVQCRLRGSLDDTGMNDVEELKQFAAVHARTQGITADRSEAVLRRITTDNGGEPGSWAGEWARAAWLRSLSEPLRRA